MKSRKQLSSEEDWEESSLRIIVQLCTTALKSQLTSKAKHSELERKCRVNDSLDLIKELIHSSNESQDLALKMANGMVNLHCTGQNGKNTAQCCKRFNSQVEVSESELAI